MHSFKYLLGNSHTSILKQLNLYSMYGTRSCVFSGIISRHICSSSQGLNVLIKRRHETNSVLNNYRQTREFSVLSFTAAVATSAPVRLAQEVFEWVHDTSGLPWWLTIVGTTVSLRLMLLPLFIYQNHLIARYENLLLEMKELVEELKKEMSRAVRLFKWDEKTAKRVYRVNVKKHITSLIVRDNCHPVKIPLLTLLQLPMWISISFALRNMVGYGMYLNEISNLRMTFLQMSVGGILWFPNLTIPDETFVIPILLGVVNLTIIEISTLRKLQKGTKFHRIITNCFRGITIIMIPISMVLPSCITLYWLQSSIFGLGQNLIFHIPKVRRLFRIPQSPSESQTPFQDMLQNFKLRFKRTKSV